MLHLVCYLVLVLQSISCSQLTSYNDGRYPPSVDVPNGTYIELDIVEEAPYFNQHSYQNDEFFVKKFVKAPEAVPYFSTVYAFLRKGKIASSTVSCSLILAFMLHVHDICWDPKMSLPLFLFGMLISIPILFEFSFTFVGLFELFDEDCPNTGKLGGIIKTLLSIATVGLQIMRVAAAAAPYEPYESITDELCTWKGDTLFTSTKWTTLVFTPSVLLILIPIVELLIGYLFPNYLSEGQRKKTQ